MRKLTPIAVSVACALFLGGCASPMQKQANRSPGIQPLLDVKHGVDAQAMYRLGRSLEDQSRHEAAIQAYNEALKRDPVLVEAYTGLGMALAALQRYDEAIRQFQAAIVLAPSAAHLHNNLGYAYLLGGQTDKAVRALEEARRLDPAHARATQNLRLAEQKLSQRPSGPVATPATAPTMPTVHAAATATSLVEVAPQVYELRMPPAPRSLEKIHAEPLPPVPPAQPRATHTRGFKLEIANGNGVLGMAKRVAGRLVDAGLNTARLTNQLPFNQPSTEVQYREGYQTEAAALAATLQHPVQVKPSSNLARHIDVRLVLGRDVSSDVALMAPAAPNRDLRIAAR